MEEQSDTIYICVAFYRIKKKIDFKENLDMPWNRFASEGLNVRSIMDAHFPKLRRLDLNKIELDGKTFSHCCNNFGKMTCCKANKKLRELGFQPGSTITYFFGA